MPSIWTGAITFGLVHIPVHLESAVRASDRISFRQLHKKDLSPIRYERVCQKEGESVPWGEIVKGYEYAKGKFVVLTEEDLKAAATPSSKTIDILDFVGSDDIDPRFFETPYFLLPNKGGEKPYALLREAIRESGMVGVGKVTIRQNQHLAAVKVVGDALVLEIMRFPEELVDVSTYAFPSADVVRPQELQMARQLVDNLAEKFDPSKYVDDQRAALMRIIKAKMKGKKIEPAEVEEPDGTPVVDLMARLRASIERGKEKPARGARSRGEGEPKARKTTARKRRTA